MTSRRSGVGLAVVNQCLYACGGFDGSYRDYTCGDQFVNTFSIQVRRISKQSKFMILKAIHGNFAAV